MLIFSLFKYISSCPSKNYFPQSFPDFYSISFPGFYSGEKWEVFQSYENFFQGPKELSFEVKSLQSVFDLKQILTNSIELTSSCPSKNYILKSFPDLNSIFCHGFLSGKNMEIVSMLIQTHIKLPVQILLLTIFSRFQLHFISWVSLWRKMTKLLFCWRLFFQGSKSSPLKWSPNNLFSIFSKF